MSLLAVNHHYFRTVGTGQGIYPITPDALTAQIRRLQQHWLIGGEAEILAHCHGAAENVAACVLTFDDGLKEQMQALSCLENLGAKALFFVPTAPLVEHEVLDVHKLHMIRSRCSDEQLAGDLQQRFGFDQHPFDEPMLAIQYRYDMPISRRVKYFLNFVLEPQARKDWTRTLFGELFGCERAACDALYMDRDDLRLLASRHLLGTHAHSHIPLAPLSEVAMCAEIEESLGVLETLTGQRPIGISYPFGGKTAVSEALFGVAASVGLQYGFTMERGINDSVADSPLALKRIDTNDVNEWVKALHFLAE